MADQKTENRLKMIEQAIDDLEVRMRKIESAKEDEKRQEGYDEKEEEIE